MKTSDAILTSVEGSSEGKRLGSSLGSLEG
jgi:hypothetical protein